MFHIMLVHDFAKIYLILLFSMGCAMGCVFCQHNDSRRKEETDF